MIDIFLYTYTTYIYSFNMKNQCLHPRYSNTFTKKNIETIFVQGDRFTRIVIKPILLQHLQVIIKYSHTQTFQSYKDYDRFMVKMRKKLKYNVIVPKTVLFAHYRVLLQNKLVERNIQLEKFMRIKGARSRSGVVSVTIFMSGSIMGSDRNDLIDKGGCPMDCHYCPFEKDKQGNSTQPRSYLSTEPGCARASQQQFSPVGQVYTRLFQLDSIGHISNHKKTSNKIELIISGGTFNFYPIQYIEWFSTCAYYACNTYYEAKDNKDDFSNVRHMKSLAEEKKINESSSNRVIGLTIETRPDYIMPKHKNKENDFTFIRLFRDIGVTRVQIGIQTTHDNILKKINRGCTNKDNIRGVRLLKQNGFKTDIHIMLDLPSSSPEIDKKVIDEIVDSPDIQADQWKLYPTEVTNFTKIKQWYDAGLYVPYSEDHSQGTSYKMLDVLIHGLTRVPPYIRINRVVRDIPHKSIEGGLRCSNMRQLATNKMKKKGIVSQDIRVREVKYKNIDIDDMILDVIEYPSSGGTEYFIQYCSQDKKTLYGFVRLRLNNDVRDTLPCLQKCALIRELHVYGQHTSIGTTNKNLVQHKGLGTKLLQKAESLARTHNYKRIAVISGVGVRNYYRKKGYTLGESDYMYKVLPIIKSPNLYSTRTYIALCMICMALYIIFQESIITS